MVATTEAKFTRREYMLLPEGLRAELLDGLLVKEPSPASWHQVLVMRLASELVRLVGTGRALVSPIDVFLGEHDVLQPDLLVLAEEDAVRPGDREVAIPLLVLEVLSPSTADRDRNPKTGIYLRAGVREVWLVDPETESVEIHDAGGVRRFGKGDAPGSKVLPAFAPDLPALFGG